MARTNAAPATDGIPPIFHMIARHSHLIVPISFLVLVGVLVVPLPTTVLDLLLCINIAIGAIVLMTTDAVAASQPTPVSR